MCHSLPWQPRESSGAVDPLQMTRTNLPHQHGHSRLAERGRENKNLSKEEICGRKAFYKHSCDQETSKHTLKPNQQDTIQTCCPSSLSASFIFCPGTGFLEKESKIAVSFLLAYTTAFSFYKREREREALFPKKRLERWDIPVPQMSYRNMISLALSKQIQ